VPDSIKISDLTKLDASSLSVEDQIIINDTQRSDGQVVTHHVQLGDIIGYITGEVELTFSKDVEFSGDVIFSSGSNVQLDADVTLTGDLTISGGSISGLTLSSLDDVEVGSVTEGQTIGWDSANSRWSPKTIVDSDDFYTKTEVDNLLATAVVFSTTQPSAPRTGQFWMKTDTNMLYVYDGTTFVATRPDGLLIGDNL